MVCIEKRPYTLYGRLAALHFRYLTGLLDRGHIKMRLFFLRGKFWNRIVKKYVLFLITK